MNLGDGVLMTSSTASPLKEVLSDQVKDSDVSVTALNRLRDEDRRQVIYKVFILMNEFL